MAKKVLRFSDAIRKAVESEGVGVRAFVRKHEIPAAWFYCLLRGQDPISEKTKRPLRKLKAAGVRHPLLDLVA